MQHLGLLKMQKQRSSSLETIKEYSNNTEQYKQEEVLGSPDDVKQWEEARCPVCLEHPHNAVFLRCSSYNKGCRPFMCNTSYRHSNCLDQFCESFVPSPSDLIMPGINAGQIDVSGGESENKLACPFCRGQISGWFVLKPAREFMNLKVRSCYCENCDFTGNYAELRKHARDEHPTVRPSAIDPERQRNWMLERDSDLPNLLSVFPSVNLELGGGEEGMEEEEEEEENDIILEGSNLEFVDEILYFGSMIQYAAWSISYIMENLEIYGLNNYFRQGGGFGSSRSERLPPIPNMNNYFSQNPNNFRDQNNSRNNNIVRNNSNYRRNNRFGERQSRNRNNYRHNNVNNNLNPRQNNSLRGNNTERMRHRRINSFRLNDNTRRNRWDRGGTGSRSASY